MVKIEIIAVGKDKETWLSDGSGHYEKLLKKFCRIDWTIVNTAKFSSSLSPSENKSREAALITKHLSDGYIVALSDSGKMFDSPDLARELQKILSHSSSTIKFVIGGPYGLDKSIIIRADMVLSLSPLTFSHQIVRLVLLEQLFRAFSILGNTDYHK